MSSRVRNLVGPIGFGDHPSLWTRHEAPSSIDWFNAVRANLGDADRSDRRELLASLRKLSQETDPAFRQHGLLYLAREQEREERPHLAAALYRSAIAETPDPETRRRAEAGLAALAGHGPWGERFERQLSNFSRQVTDPGLLASMAMAGLVYSVTRGATLAALLGSGRRAWWARGLGANALASGLALTAEAPTFTLGLRGYRTLLGENLDWSSGALTRDILANGLTLFSLKAMGGLSTRGLRSIRQSGGLNPSWARLSSAALPQLGMFAGILGARGLESAWGLRDSASPDAILSESLVTLLHFNIAGRLVPRFGMDPIQRRVAGLEATPLREPWLAGLWGPARLMPAIAPSRPFESPSEIWMSNHNENPKRPPVSQSGWVRLGEREMVPVFSDPEIYQAFRRQFSRLEGDITFFFNEQPGSPLHFQQGLRYTIETYNMIRNLRENISDPEHRETLRAVAENLTVSYHNLRKMPGQDYLHFDHDLAETWRRYMAPVARISNKTVNFLFTSDPADLEGVLVNSSHARLASFDLARPFIANPDAEVAAESETPPYRDMFALPGLPEPPRVPSYDFITLKGASEESYDIPGENRQVVLLGNIPLNRVELSSRHDLEIFTRDRPFAVELARQAMTRGDVNRIKFLGRDPGGQVRAADYVEAYGLFSLAELQAPEGPRHLQELLLNKIKVGGVGYVVSSEARPIEAIAEILTRHGLGDVLWGSLSTSPLVPMEGAGDIPINILLFRKVTERKVGE